MSEMRPWLFRVATNHCLNELRSRGVRARTPPQLALTTTSNLEDVMAARNDARRFLERLTPRARAIAWLTYVDGMLQQEVAETLGVSRRTVVLPEPGALAARAQLARPFDGALGLTRVWSPHVGPGSC